MADNKMISIREFKMWLQGVEEMQDANWIPNATQWAKIREKINTIADVAPEQPLPPLRLATQPAVPVEAPRVPAGPAVIAGPSSLGVAPQQPTLSPALVMGNGLAKTPDIDTSGKRYESGFV
jgi:hypothetical protein